MAAKEALEVVTHRSSTEIPGEPLKGLNCGAVWRLLHAIYCVAHAILPNFERSQKICGLEIHANAEVSVIEIPARALRDYSTHFLTAYFRLCWSKVSSNRTFRLVLTGLTRLPRVSVPSVSAVATEHGCRRPARQL